MRIFVIAFLFAVTISFRMDATQAQYLNGVTSGGAACVDQIATEVCAENELAKYVEDAINNQIRKEHQSRRPQYKNYRI